MRRLLHLMLVLVLLIAGGAAARAGESGAPAKLVLAIVPRLPPAATHRDWSPLIERLRRTADVDIELRVFRSFGEFEGFVFSGSADLAFVNPYQQLELRKKLGFVPLVRDGARLLSGVLVVRADSPVRTVRELDGREVAFPHPNAFGASLHMRALLQEEMGVAVKPVYVDTHGNVYRHVLLGKVAAGGGVNVTLSKEPEHLRKQLRVLFETPGVAPHPLAAHPRVRQAVRERVTNAVLELERDATGRAMLAAVTLNHPVRANYETDYQPLERLRLERYYVQTDIPEQ